MDFIPDWAHSLIEGYTPAYLQPVHAAVGAARRHLLPLIDNVVQHPDIASVALLLIVLVISLKILDMLRRAVVFWITMAIRLIFWAGLLFAGLYLYNRGLEDTVDDIFNLGHNWKENYEHYSYQADQARRFHRQVYGRGGNRRGGTWG
ncbi:hypothetical protein M501DRAFT_1013532 [Patellaria atrata CBS 101060]|uniref:Uncharacterized protein n=1 Tax=Patellaria atrata CBS 101060 TaxID=1346257 RepID=A0A9P4VUN6_9PEZI|nr:hypothetical protein M501DRAFT_1013532 [Patellaria atrata CBS 101060]